MDIARTGTITYETTLVVLDDDAREGFALATLHHNAATRRTVAFDGARARIEEVNADYSVRSPCVRVCRAGDHTARYSKALHRLRFATEVLAEPPADAGDGGSLAPLDGTVVVAGRRCRRAIYSDAWRRLAIAYTEEVAVDDPTGAVHRLDGVPGLLLAWEELSNGPHRPSRWRTKVAVTHLTLAPPDPAALEVPPGYLWFPGVDAARAEDRRLLEAEADAEPSPRTADALCGRWRWEHGAVELEIVERAGALRFRTTVADGVRDEAAAIKGRLLLVEEPPGYRLYRLESGGRRLVQTDDETFAFGR